MINFDEIIDKYLKRELRAKDIGRYYPSEAGNCLRKGWYSYKIPRVMPKETIKVFKVGMMLHDFITEVLSSGVSEDIKLVSTELPFKLEIDGVIVSGRIDDIVHAKVDNKDILVEVKSTADIRYAYEPKESHVMQLQLYMYAFKIFDGVVLYVDKRNLQSKSFDVKYEEKIVELVLNRIKNLHRFLVENKVPDPEGRMFKEMNWQCNNCQYREECYKETPKEILP
ncbi:MAG: Dna2/Cas4 domain-containing protein [Nanoarchaeota archaeon]